MSKIVIKGNIHTKNNQIGDDNTQHIYSDVIDEVDWDILIKAVENSISKEFVKQKEELIHVMNNRNRKETKSFLKTHFSEYCTGILTDLTSVALIEVMKFFI